MAWYTVKTKLAIDAVTMIQEWFIILMILSYGDSISSVNHATADKSLNVFISQRECEAALPDFVNATYPEFRPQANLLNHQVVMNGVAESPAGRRSATWRCTTIFMTSSRWYLPSTSPNLPASIFRSANTNIHPKWSPTALRRFRNLGSIWTKYLQPWC